MDRLAMKVFGVDFPEPKRPVCELCAEPMTLTGRMPDTKRGAGHEIQVFECYACRRELAFSVTKTSEDEVVAEPIGKI
jgi:hypothetical protein